MWGIASEDRRETLINFANFGLSFPILEDPGEASMLNTR